MVRKICLDTNILISLLAGDKKTKERIEQLEGNFYTTAVNVFELWFGRKKEEKIFELLKWLHIFELDEKSAKISADIMRTLKKQGTIIEIRDLFIAAICLQNDLELLTYDQHFERLKKFGLILL